jgi:RNA polymerase sigma factor (sigma-70 family)
MRRLEKASWLSRASYRGVHAKALPEITNTKWLEHEQECDLAFRSRHCSDDQALAILMNSFERLDYGIASERFRTGQLGKGVKVVNRSRANNNYPIAGHFQELMARGHLGLLDAALRYNGQHRFSTYASFWAYKRMQEYVRWNWNVVLMPEPANCKVARADKIPPTHPNPAMNPFENPYSMDKLAAMPRHIDLEKTSENETTYETINYRPQDETEVGRYWSGESSEYQALAHQTMEAMHRAIELETMAAALHASYDALAHRKYRIIRARFPRADDVQNATDSLDEYGYPKKLKRGVIGEALGITPERVRQIEEVALEDIRRGAGGTRQEPDSLDKLVEALPKQFPTRKRWLAPRIAYEEVVIQGKLLPKRVTKAFSSKAKQEEEQRALLNCEQQTGKRLSAANYNHYLKEKAVEKRWPALSGADWKVNAQRRIAMMTYVLLFFWHARVSLNRTISHKPIRKDLAA